MLGPEVPIAISTTKRVFRLLRSERMTGQWRPPEKNKVMQSRTLLGFVLFGTLLGSNGDASAVRRPDERVDVPSSIYYVDSRAGDDSNAGTSPASAWKSLEKVNARTFLPGDRILLKSSSMWNGQLWPKGSGVEGRPITVGMYGGGVKPVINGEGLFEE